MTERDRRLRRDLDAVYAELNTTSLIDTDPLAAVLAFDGDAEREIVGLVAASLAYGRVAHIRSSIDRVVTALDGRPAAFLHGRSAAAIASRVAGIRHRFSSGRDIGDLLVGTKRVLEIDGSLARAFARGFTVDAEDAVDAAIAFVDRFSLPARPGSFRLLPSPRDGSACKRLFMYFRWMVRCDAVDLGLWPPDAKAHLVVPVDTHMHRIGRSLRFTRRSGVDLVTARELTRRFRRIRPDDPARYDFALTRLGMRGDLGAVSRLGRPPAPSRPG